MSVPKWRPSRRDLLRLGGLTAAGAAVSSLAACNGESVTGAGSSKELQFMYWGSTFEKTAVQKMLDGFESKHKGVTTKALFTPSDYETKLNTLVASNRSPDVAYLGASTAFRLAESGKLLNLYDYIDKYPGLKDRLPSSYFWYGKDKLLGSQTANEVQLLWYNRKVLKDAGVKDPPAEADKAWSWDDFVETAHKLTIDQKGKRADESGFDPTKIRQFGCSFGAVSWLNAEAMIRSQGADLFNEDGTKSLLDTPEVIKVYQNIADLAYKYHVAPTATQLGNNAPSTTVQLQTKRIAMVADGQWTLLDLAQSDLDYGVGVLPKYDKPVTIGQGGATSVFADTQDKDLAMELYMYHNDPAQVDLFSDGLWMPLDKKYYTEDKDIDLWTKNDVHPAEYRTAAVDYTVNNSVGTWSQSIKNSDAINEVLTPALQQIDQGKKKAAEVCKALAPKVTALLKGRYPQQDL
ncbi:extracellular solute-binding protein [Microlunatus soli]|uniref:Multiple sugar transport system substrate-binding protein n=1 Tax=Microlunatus soli TaxID=630515 RepID=A0A1H1S083_9ACTN|nr:extracellular solute-binding protein [Microlunatus soli]SDS41355.1 multiple sugar transport system substrate-binding protein [Microlunatus soli]